MTTTVVGSAVILLLIRSILKTGGDPHNFESTILYLTLMVIVAIGSWFGGGIKSLFFPPVHEIFVDPQNRFIEMTRYGILGKQRERYLFHQVKKFRSYKPKQYFSPPYSLELILVNKQRIRIKVSIGEDKVEVTKFIKKLNILIREPKPSVAEA